MELEEKKLWKETAEYMIEDIKYYKELFGKSINGAGKLTDEVKSMFEKCDDFLVNSNLVLSQLNRYSNFMEKELECDDLQCDSYFSNYENLFKVEVKTHFENYKELKNILLVQLNQ